MVPPSTTLGQRPLAHQLARTFLLMAVLVVGTLAMAAGCLVLVVAHDEPRVDGLIEARSGIRLTHAGMLDEETALRGYLGTGQSAYLDPYDAGQREIAAGDAAYASLASDGGLTDLVLGMRVAEQRWISEWAQPAAAMHAGDLQPGQLDGFLRSGKALFDGYRGAEALLDDAVTARIGSTEASERLTAIIGLGIALAALIGFSAVVIRQHRVLARSLVGPIGDLVTTMRRVRSGDLEARPTGGGPQELVEVAQALSEMTDELLAERATIAALEAGSRFQAERLRLIVRVGREIAGSLSLRYVTQAVASAAIEVSGFESVRIWLMADGERHLVAVTDTGAPGGQPVAVEPVQLGDGLLGRAAQDGHTLSAGRDSVPTEHREAAEIVALALPMIVGARVVGVIELADERGCRVDAATLDVIGALAGQAATAVEAARLHQRADELSRTDALTRLPNRRRLDEDLDVEVARSRRHHRPLALVMLDVDHFKTFNDRHGHQVGDEILAEFGTAFADALRATDTAYRFGGEEFCVILRETDLSAAMPAAERLRATIEARFATGTGRAAVTASLGVAAMPDHALDAAGLVGAADAALYRAKASGRNRVVVATPADGVDLVASAQADESAPSYAGRSTTTRT